MDRNQEAKQFKYTFSALCLTIPKGKYQVDGFISRKELEYDLDMKFKYDNLAHFVSVKSNGKRGTDTYHTYLEAHSSQYPDLAFAINYDLKHGKGLVSALTATICNTQLMPFNINFYILSNNKNI